MNTMNQLTEIKTESNIGNRFTAGLIDYIFIYGFTFAYVFAFGEPNDEGSYSVSGLPALGPVIFWGIMTIGLEQWFGATLGNLFVGLKPVSINYSYNKQTGITLGEKLTFGQSFKRHFLDPIDMFFFGLIGYVTIKNTEKNQRLGDIWANTIVIKTTATQDKKQITDANKPQ